MVVVRIGTERYGFDVAAVVEVVGVSTLQRVPAASPAVRGVIERHGRHATLVALGALLTGDKPPVEPAPVALVVRLREAEVALEVDEVEGVAGGTQVAASAPGLPARGVWRCRLEDGGASGAAEAEPEQGRLVTLLDPEQLAERVAALEERRR